MATLISETGETVVRLEYSELTSKKGERVTELTFKDPKTGELNDISSILHRIKKTKAELTEFDILMAAITVLATPKVSLTELRNLDLADLYEVAEVLNNFRAFKLLQKK
jgi:hypothetical protein